MLDYERQFFCAKRKALEFLEHYNAAIPTTCPQCEEQFVAGLPCECGYCHPIPWGVLQGSEWGYEIVAIGNRRKVILEFPVEEDYDDEAQD